jgi:hypothetical protein
VTADLYQAAIGDRYLARVEDGTEFLVRLGVRPINPLLTWQGNPPYGLLTVLVTGVTAEGVEEEAHVMGAGAHPERLGVGWSYVGRGALVQVFRRMRKHDVHVMPERQAEGLIARLRAAQVDQQREREEQEKREAPLRAMEAADWARLMAETERRKRRMDK